MLFSIITVCFNSETTIRQTFDSVLQQEFKDYEYIVIDGASTDGTVDIIKEYEPKFNGRMRWSSEPDTGIYNAMNKGIGLASGDFAAFIGSDDFYEPDCLQRTADWIAAHPGFQIYYGMIRWLDAAHQETKIVRHSHRLLKQCSSLCHQGVFTAARLLRDMHGFDESYHIVGDYDFFLRVNAVNDSLFCPMDFIVASYAGTGISSTPEHQVRSLQEIGRTLVKHQIWDADYAKLCVQEKRYMSLKQKILRRTRLQKIINRILILCYHD